MNLKYIWKFHLNKLQKHAVFHDILIFEMHLYIYNNV